MPLSPGDTVDRYTLEALLGEGGMGEVYRAFDARLQRRVALKIVRVRPGDGGSASSGAGSGGSAGTARIVREARAAAALDHPNAVAIYDVGTAADGTAFLAMELIDGRTLRAYVGDAQVPLEDRLRWLADVARALAAAHRRGLVHRDVKPENVMVRSDGVVKVLDFGIARRAEAPIDAMAATTPEGLGTITQEGTLIGTPLYMAPEQLKGEPLDGRVDQFAWGVLAYELLAGRVPWKTEQHAYRVVAAILAVDPPPLAELVPELPAGVAEAVARTLAKEPRDRFAAMDDVVAALDEATGTKRERPPAAARSVAPTAQVRTDMSASGSLAPRAPSAAPAALPARGRARWIALGIAVAAGAALFALAPRFGASERRGGAPASPASSVTDAPEGGAATDFPLPSSSRAEAIEAYRAGMQAFRDGIATAWNENLTRAVELDPELAAAHLRLSWIAQSTSSSAAREHFSKALLLRSALSDRDRALLDAGVPYFHSDPADLPETARRMEAAVLRFPRDAELLYFLGATYAEQGDFAQAIAAHERAIAVDPKFAFAWAFAAIYRAYLDDADAAQGALASCLANAPGATLCLHFRAMLDQRDGNCARVEADARRMIATQPSGSVGYAYLAEAAYANGLGLDVAREALRQSRERQPTAARADAELVVALRLAEIEGDFAAAEKSARALDALRAARDDEGAHAEIAAALVAIDAETGRARDAGEVARAFLAKRAAWVTNLRGEDYAVAADMAPSMLAAELRAGLLDARAFEAAQTEWLDRWTSKLAEPYLHTVWLQGVARTAETPTEAKRALDMLPRFGAPLAFGPIALAAADLGRVYLRAGRTDEAIAALTRATRACVALGEPIAHTRAHALLGEALEAKGDAKGACAEYAVVAARWAHAKPRSVTAESAARRAAALRCGRW